MTPKDIPEYMAQLGACARAAASAMARAPLAARNAWGCRLPVTRAWADFKALFPFEEDQE